MRLRGIVTTVALVLSTVALAPGGVAHAASAAPRADAPLHHRQAHAPRSRHVERGTFRMLTSDVPDGTGKTHDVVRPVLERADGSWLDLHVTKQTTPSFNTQVELSGVGDDASMDVESVSYPIRSGPRMANLGTQPTTGTTKVLVILAYWTSPDSVTQAQAQNVVFTKGNPWWKETSYGAVAITGQVTPWLHIAAPSGDCYSYADQIMSRARAAASSYNPGAYQRVVVYMPACAYAPGWAYIGAGSVWLDGEMDLRVSVHEQGHNYGLYHAHSYACTVSGKPVTLGGSCSQAEYGDDFDAMGGGSYVGQFSGRQKRLLGWIGGTRYQAVTGSTSLTLTPYESGSALKAASVVVGSRTYWLEYRTAAGVDKGFPQGGQGLQIRMVQSGLGDPGPNALDLRPGDSGWDDFESVSMPVLSSWTSPDNVRFRVGTATTSGLPVTITYGAGAPTAPTPPQSPAAVAGDGSATVRWARPASDNGAAISSYRVVTSPGNKVVSFPTVGGALTSGVVEGLANGTAYTFTIQAHNLAGDSVASTRTAAVTPTAAVPKVTLTSPASGAVLTGETAPLTASVSSSPLSHAAITSVEYFLDGESAGYSSTAPFSSVLDLRYASTGAHVLQAQAYDANGRRGDSAKVTVTYQPPLPQVSITSPTAGQVIGTSSTDIVLNGVPGSPSHPLYSVWVTADDGGSIGGAYSTTGSTWTLTWDVSQLSEGQHTLIAHATDDQDRTAISAPVTVTVQHPSPVVAITSPAAGATLHGTSDVLVHVAPHPGGDGGDVQSVQLVADGVTQLATTYLGGTGTDSDPWVLPVDWRQLGNGPHTLTARAVNADGFSAMTPQLGIDVENPAPTVTLQQPVEGATLSGLVTLTAAVAPDGTFPAPVSSVVFLADGTQVAYATDNGDGTWTASWDTAQGDQGARVLTAQATDSDGYTGTSGGRGVTLDNPGPAVVLTSPSDGATVQGDLALTATATPNPATSAAISSVEYDVDGSAYVYGDSGSASWPATLPSGWLAAGPHTLQAKVYDNDGLARTSSPIDVVIVTAPDAPEGLTAVAHTSSVDLLWSPPSFTGGAALTGFKVQRVDDIGAVLSSVTLPDPAATAYTLSGLTGDSVNVQVLAVGPAGDSQPATYFGVDLAPQPVTGLTAIGGYGRATLHWTASTSGDVSHVAVLVAKGSTAPPLSTAPSADLYDPAATGATVTGLAATTTYTVSVVVYDYLEQTSTLTTTTLLGTTLTTAASPASVAYGGTATLTGTLYRAGTATRLAGRPLTLYHRRHGTSAWSKVATVTTSSTGVATAKRVPLAHTDYRWSFAGSGTELGAEGAVRLVKVVVRVSGTLSASSVALKRSVTMSAGVSPNHKGQRVYLQRLSGRTWVNVVSAVLGSTSAARFTIVGSTRGTFSYRVYKPSDADHTGGYSPVRTVRVV